MPGLTDRQKAAPNWCSVKYGPLTKGQRRTLYLVHEGKSPMPTEPWHPTLGQTLRSLRSLESRGLVTSPDGVKDWKATASGHEYATQLRKA